MAGTLELLAEYTTAAKLATQNNMAKLKCPAVAKLGTQNNMGKLENPAASRLGTQGNLGWMEHTDVASKALKKLLVC